MANMILPQERRSQVFLDKYISFYFDHDKFRKEIKSILKANDLEPEDIASSIGYTDRTLTNYLYGYNDSRFIAGALCDRFRLNPKSFTKEGY